MQNLLCIQAAWESAGRLCGFLFCGESGERLPVERSVCRNNGKKGSYFGWMMGMSEIKVFYGVIYGRTR
ncbi:hypothetical protein EHV15_02855 [Paenibacillus oralis]|uniref:Uncharacterized protein n=1 Tax=Paenibacillus oralis TaxID=2490856 RepID=A0A3P3TV55_9BACL|nr:hypothetical protein [Paenibacillus oralis]RRJ62021.1 hypothetical protein EHV15_02855 [Paenibacillus oralis]